jgi:hypothetical protein
VMEDAVYTELGVGYENGDGRGARRCAFAGEGSRTVGDRDSFQRDVNGCWQNTYRAERRTCAW